MPPPLSDTRSLSTLAKVLAASLGIVLLSACASQQQASDQAQLTPEQIIRNSYMARTQSDPLGAWLKRDTQVATSHPQSFPGQASTDSALSADTTIAPVTMAATAMKFLGVKYRNGGNSPGQGFDCSGLVAYAAEKSLGLRLPRTANAQASMGVSVDSSQLRRGDLVFFNTLGRRFSHVGIYLGDRKFVHAPRSGASIRVENMDIAYWRNRYNGARRLLAHSDALASTAESTLTPASTVSRR